MFKPGTALEFSNDWKFSQGHFPMIGNAANGATKLSGTDSPLYSLVECGNNSGQLFEYF
jgi:hypothetical protein